MEKKEKKRKKALAAVLCTPGDGSRIELPRSHASRARSAGVATPTTESPARRAPAIPVTPDQLVTWRGVGLALSHITPLTVTVRDEAQPGSVCKAYLAAARQDLDKLEDFMQLLDPQWGTAGNRHPKKKSDDNQHIYRLEEFINTRSAQLLHLVDALETYESQLLVANGAQQEIRGLTDRVVELEHDSVKGDEAMQILKRERKEYAEEIERLKRRVAISETVIELSSTQNTPTINTFPSASTITAPPTAAQSPRSSPGQTTQPLLDVIVQQTAEIARLRANQAVLEQKLTKKKAKLRAARVIPKAAK